VASCAATTDQQEPTFPLPPLSYREVTRLTSRGEGEERGDVVASSVVRYKKLVAELVYVLMTTLRVQRGMF
jgi:hypothetical protein